MNRMESVPRIALDTEADSLYHYFEKVCLIQLSMNGDNFIVDPLSGIDLSPFLKLLAGKDLILHAADYDLRMLLGTFGFRPHAAVFDTMLAAQLLGYEQLGLAALVERSFDVTLPKQKKKSDWSRRPLSDQQLDYASDDTRFLEPMADRLFDALRELGRDGWHQEWCEWLVEVTGRDRPPPDPDREWRLKGMNGIGRRELAFVREIWRWRDWAARAADLPPFKIMGNSQILELSSWAASNRTARIEDGPILPRHITGRRLNALRQAIQKARRTPTKDLPDHLEERRPEPTPPKLRTLRRECARVAEELGIPASVLAPRAALEAVTKRHPRTVGEVMECGPMMQWQAELVAPVIQRVLENRVC